MKNSFHGRTITTITATGQTKYQKNFGPLTPGFSYVDYCDVEAAVDAITENTAAVLVEPVQGEGGIIVPPKDYLKELKAVCHEGFVCWGLEKGCSKAQKCKAPENIKYG